jgi:hypothetical protein
MVTAGFINDLGSFYTILAKNSDIPGVFEAENILQLFKN